MPAMHGEIRKTATIIILGLLISSLSPLALAKVTAEEAAKLGNELTSVGAQRSANADGSIPAWEGGLKSPPAGFKTGGLLVHPYADEKPLFTINAQNYTEYESRLTAGQIALLKTYPDTFQIPVFPTHRSAALPQFLYDETVKNALRAELDNEGNGIAGTLHGFPFPIPRNGREAMWNHVLRYNTTGYKGFTNNAVVTPDGDHVVERTYFEFAMRYNRPDTRLDDWDNRNQFVFLKVVAPATKTGDAFLVHVPLDRKATDTGVWVYNGGQRKIRRIGEVGYDNPLFDGLMTHDQVDMFNGPMDRYSFKLVGKKEIYVPYNNYEFYSQKYKYGDLIDKGHLNNSLARYELHRVWVVEADVIPGQSHIYPKRVFYIDEDSWQVLLEDMYDTRGEFWRTSESYAVVFYPVPVLINLLQVHYDLQSRQYVVLNMSNEEKSLIEWNVDLEPGYFNPQNLKKFATKLHH